jgi:peptidoglycan hydrolase-like protein with peptidoglycan-binding domain
VSGVLAAVGGGIAQNPLTVGGGTAFLVALSFISANALWYQPHFHAGAFFHTRDVVSGRRAIHPPPPAADGTRAAAQSPSPDPTVGKVQSALSALHLYGGAVDGVDGPQTRGAIEDYRKSVGLANSGDIDAALLKRLGIAPPAPPVASPPVPSPRVDGSTTQSVEPTDEDAARVRRIQAGLKAFGNDGIEVDGVVGPRTRAAIREFQSLFGLPVTGEPDDTVSAKMHEVGLIN